MVAVTGAHVVCRRQGGCGVVAVAVARAEEAGVCNVVAMVVVACRRQGGGDVAAGSGQEDCVVRLCVGGGEAVVCWQAVV